MDKIIIKKSIEKHISDIIEWRHWLHAHPELSTKEKETSAFIKKTLEAMGLTVETYNNSYGLTAVIEGNGEGKCLGIRADFDALPVTENTGLAFSSVNEGVMHACGHDMHTSILLGTAAVLCDLKNEFKGKVKLIFQPAEEISSMLGSGIMIDEGCLESPHVDAIIAEHMWPELKAGQIGIRSGVLTAATDKIEITVCGKAAHGGSTPQKGIDAIVIASEIIVALQSIVSRTAGPFESMVLTIGKISGGTAYNIVADKVVLTGTMRTVSEEIRTRAVEKLESICSGIASAMGGTCRIEYTGSYDLTVNDTDICDIAENAVKETDGTEAIRLEYPSMIGEDFSLFTRKIPGCMYCFGTKKDESDISSLHQSTYAPSDDLLETGVRVMAGIAMQYFEESL